MVIEVVKSLIIFHASLVTIESSEESKDLQNLVFTSRIIWYSYSTKIMDTYEKLFEIFLILYINHNHRHAFL